MSKLRDDIFPILQRATDTPLGGDLTPHTDAILAKVREALLRDEAVEAGAKRMLGVQQNHGVGLTISEDYAWGVQFDDGREEARQEARAAITAALDAVIGEDDAR